jgi:hypothetical protein
MCSHYSPIITKIIEAYTIDTQRGVDILNNIKIPKFEAGNELHNALASLSLLAHHAKIKGHNTSLLEKKIDVLVERLFAC